MELSAWQNDLVSCLAEKGLPREDLFSVMLVLSRPEKGEKMLKFLRETENVTPDDICQKAGEIAFEEEKTES